MCFKYYKETKKLNITKTQKNVSNLFHKKHNNKKTKKICFDLIDPKMIQKRETYFYTNLGFPVNLFSQFIKITPLYIV